MEKSRRRLLHSSLDSGQHSSSPSPPLPIELMIDIFARLSLKSIAICRCVSKQWASVLAQSDLRDLRLTRSQARPRLLFACKDYDKAFFLSIPQPQSLDQISSSPVAADYHMSFSFDHAVEEISPSSGGYVRVLLSGYRSVNGRKYMVDEESVICNPSTGQSLPLPRMNTSERDGMIHNFGYDPVEKLPKVFARLCHHHETTMDHQVLTLGGAEKKKATWRMTECGIPCSTSLDRQNICIDGVFYYIEFVGDGCGYRMLMCFDVRSEEYSFVKFPEMLFSALMLDYNGKLGLVARGITLTVTCESIELWVLQDPERHEWSKRGFHIASYVETCSWSRGAVRDCWSDWSE